VERKKPGKVDVSNSIQKYLNSTNINKTSAVSKQSLAVFQLLMHPYVVEPIANATLTTLREEPTRALVLLITVSAVNRHLKWINPFE